jgi:hypothetical protein
MQEGRFLRHLQSYFPNGVPTELIQIYFSTLESIHRFAGQLPVPSRVSLSAGENSLTISLYNYHIISRLLKIGEGNNRQPGVVEIGPGSGYLTLLLASSGVPVRTIDNTQPFVLYQKALFDFHREQPNSERFVSPRQVNWWDLIQDIEDFSDVRLVTANHMLNEMHPHGLRFILGLIENAWKNNPTERFFYAETLGGGWIPDVDIIKSFADYGFNGVRFRSVFVWSLCSQQQLLAKLSETIHELTCSRYTNHALVIDFVNKLGSGKSLDERFWSHIRLTH